MIRNPLMTKKLSTAMANDGEVVVAGVGHQHHDQRAAADAVEGAGVAELRRLAHEAVRIAARPLSPPARVIGVRSPRRSRRHCDR